MPEAPSYTPPETTGETPKIEIATDYKPRERLNYEKKARLEALKEKIEKIENQLRELDDQDAQNLPGREVNAESYLRLDAERQSLREELTDLRTQIDEQGWEKLNETTEIPQPAPDTVPPENAYYVPPAEVPSEPQPSPEAPPAPVYSPEPPPYAPYSPEIGDFEQRALEAINAVVEQDDVRARERYRGLFGRVREWFDREGRRREAETLEQAGVWEKNPKWKKWLKIGAKIAGGTGIAAAMVMTGGVGAVLTPILWSGGVREAWDGALQAVEEVGWGRGRSRAELETQSDLSQSIERLKERVRAGDLDEAEFQRLLNEMFDSENQVLSRQETNMGSERRWRLLRNIASTVATVGTGLLAGVPLGAHDYDVGQTPVGNVFLDESHRVMWNLHGPHFLYNSPEEMARVAGEVAQHGYQWTLHGVGGLDTYGMASHMLGHGLPTAEKIGLVGAGAYLVGRWIEQYIPRRGGPRTPSGPYGPYGPSYYPPGSPYYGPYGPETSPYGPEAGTGAIPERTIENEHGSVERYLSGQSPEYLAELKRQNETLPAMAENCRMAVCIPASFAEHRIIYHTLEQYIGQRNKDGQPMPKESFEIEIFVNGPAEKQSDIDQTVAEIQRFQGEHPEIQVNVISKAYDRRGTIGEFRKYVTDLAVLRGVSRERQNNQLYLMFHDADGEGMDKTYLANIVEALDTDQRIEAVSTFEDYPKEMMAKYPLLHAARRLHQFSLQAMASPRYGPDPKMVGLWYGFRSSAYANAGGYKPDWWVAEDINMGMEICRHSAAGREAFKKINTRYQSNPRRTIESLEKGEPIMNAYLRFGQEEELRERRTRPVNLEKMTLGHRRFQGELEKQATGTFENIWARFFWPVFDRHPDVVARRREQGRNANLEDIKRRLMVDPTVGQRSLAEAIKVFDRSMDFWGAKYRLEQDQHGRYRVKIIDWSRLREGLEKAKTR